MKTSLNSLHNKLSIKTPALLKPIKKRDEARKPTKNFSKMFQSLIPRKSSLILFLQQKTKGISTENGLLRFFVLTMLILNMPQHVEGQGQNIGQSYSELSPLAHHKTALEVLAASKKWINQFNEGNALECANGYDKDAAMRATPFGTKKGFDEISGFWLDLVDKGASNLVYENVKIEVVDEKLAFLSADWRMNIGRGIIYMEKWEKSNGRWLLTNDDFEMLEQFKMPEENSIKSTASHEVLEKVIRTSMEWINGFNSQQAKICGSGYTPDANLSPYPFELVTGQEGIYQFWDGLIKNGARNLIYNNPVFEAFGKDRAMISSNWSMNIGEGKIFQEKWVLNENKWLLEYDDFRVLKSYQ
ncbi:hypothetical protein FVB32_10275 [Flagellimonas hymeniacidonis]|uniref:SnoaL-like domain-containing protein n=1 Tax=Flagellimonas hymeniacidonis TaxID=2603628 RepID=A0A5C8V0G9_9FLAO|nr:hypothetical protein [Flagellimonas hymeniacidonis]TXN34974.1 hypothetical protein FVB32_10275 [Flagellimonas hymeniacidonis]